eukprot:8418478-Prorocentrum_lima.AAC.1
MPLVQLASSKALTACSTALRCLKDAAVPMSAPSPNKSWFKSVPAARHLRDLQMIIWRGVNQFQAD